MKEYLAVSLAKRLAQAGLFAVPRVYSWGAWYVWVDQGRDGELQLDTEQQCELLIRAAKDCVK